MERIREAKFIDIIRCYFRPSTNNNGNNEIMEAASEDPSTNSSQTNRQCKRYSDACVFTSFVLVSMLFLVAVVVGLNYLLLSAYMTPEARFQRLRSQIIKRERVRRIGGSMLLSNAELLANEKLLAMKTVDEELVDKHILRDYESRPHFLSKYKINETDLYGILQSMPKGGLLHVHDAGMFKSDLLIKLSHENDLWACVNIFGEYEEFRFTRTILEPVRNAEYKCLWEKMRDIWKYRNNTKTVDMLRNVLTLNANQKMSVIEVSKRLRRIKRLVLGLISYKPVWSVFIFRMLEDFYNDGVIYVELRSSLPLLYDLDGRNYSIEDSAYAISNISEIFKLNYCGFLGIKLIYAPLRDVHDTNIDRYMANALLLKEKFPNFFIGFDLFNVSPNEQCQEEIIKENTFKLLRISDDIDFYFHAGDSFCYNSTVNDENLIDSLLLGSKRIASSRVMPRHPEVLRIIELLNIAIEVCPLSSHFLQYVNDFQMHPAAYLIASGYPVVIGSDLPYFWNAKAPLTDDYYVAFVGIASQYGNLALLKRLVMNSLLYSSMSPKEKNQALHMWLDMWNRWIEHFTKEFH